MIAALADTHAVIWYTYNDKRLSQTAGAFMDNAAASDDRIGLSSISLAEIVYLAEKGRIPAVTLSVVMA